MATYRLNVNGVEYQAPDLPTLQQWADEGRVLANSWVWVDSSPNPVMAQDVAGLRFGGGRVAEPPPYAQVGYTRPNYQPVANNLILAIFSTLCCCMPFGVVSIVYAAQVDGYVRSGNQGAAIDAANKAKNWAIASIVCGGIASVIYGLLVFASGANRFR